MPEVFVAKIADLPEGERKIVQHGAGRQGGVREAALAAYKAMRRREFIKAMAGTAALWPLHARAQQPAMPIVGCLAAPAEAPYAQRAAAIRQGLMEAGFIEGRNVAFDFRWADGQYDRLPALAKELVSRKVAVIVTIGGTPAVLAAKAATSTIPIVFNLGADPVQLGLVASLNRPGGNVTGLTLLATTLEAKRLELLHKMAPDAELIAVLVNPSNQQAEGQINQVRDAARLAQLKLLVLKVSTEHELESSFTTMVDRHAGALLIGADTFLTSKLDQVMSARYRIPAIAPSREFAEAGGLMAYGTNVADAYRLTGVYAGRILNGEKPADLPVVEPTRFDFLINLKTAKSLGLTVSSTLLATADEIIE